MFSQACVKNSVKRGMYPSIHFGRHTLWGCTGADKPSRADTQGWGVSKHALEQTPPWANTPLQADTLPPGRHPLPSACWDTHPPDGHCSGRYTSYWNAFLFLRINLNKMCHLQQNKRSSLFLLVETSYKPTC